MSDQSDFYNGARVLIVPTADTETTPDKASWSLIVDAGQQLDVGLSPFGSDGFGVIQVKVEGSDIEGRSAYVDIMMDGISSFPLGRGVTLAIKTQFLSTEYLFIAAPPFVDRYSGLSIMTGKETVGITLCDPIGGGLGTSMFWNSTVNMWCTTVPVKSYIQGMWIWKAYSDTPNSDEKYGIVSWGDYVDYISPDANTKLNTLFKIGTGHWKLNGEEKTLTLYAPDTEDVLFVYDLTDENGIPSVTSVYECFFHRGIE